ncbi:BPS1, chloroplastic-like protein [Tanacetum coccineum]|uniref:DNA-directed RNA polymerase n=1 Tax=Tanacetum coccineum TaxID=301880 RepID=A0ABQ5DJI2_9ASTR
MSDSALASLEKFRSYVSDNLNRALESLKLGSDFLSLAWMHECFKMLPMINNAFAKLMVEIDYPVTSWEGGSIDEYLDYTINLLDVLNLISSSLSNVNQARVSLTHALSLMENSPSLAIERMKEIKPHDSIKELKVSGSDVEKNNLHGKELIFHEAMLVLRSSGFWACGVVLSGLKSDVKPIMEITKNGVFVDSSLMALDSIFKKKFIEEGGIVKEVERVNESVRLVVSSGIGDSDGTMELKRRLEVVGNGLKGLKDEEEYLFGNVMSARNEVLEILRRSHNIGCGLPLYTSTCIWERSQFADSEEVRDGDKPRHGQKGVCSQLWPDIDMPLSANTGMRPALIINPHAFPSRMTIVMLLESIAAKMLAAPCDPFYFNNGGVTMYFVHTLSTPATEYVQLIGLQSADPQSRPFIAANQEGKHFSFIDSLLDPNLWLKIGWYHVADCIANIKGLKDVTYSLLQPQLQILNRNTVLIPKRIVEKIDHAAALPVL